jgi:hypothetical protein
MADSYTARCDRRVSPLRVSACPSVLLIFIDGLGIGVRGPHNPLSQVDSGLLSFFQGEDQNIPFDGRLAVTDPCMGIDGLPQSATGQTAILTGENAAALIGRHLNGFPSPRLKQLLGEQSIYKKLMADGRSVTFANAYTPQYFERRPRYVSATTVAAESAGLRLRTLDDLSKGEAVYHDFTNRSLIDRGFQVQACSEEEAGANLAGLAAKHDFTMYEHFITDKIGHARDFAAAVEHLRRLDRFLNATLAATDLTRHTVMVTSDHGNVEDLRTGSHTTNAVATLVFGTDRDTLSQRVRSLTDIAAAIVQFVVHRPVRAFR